MEHEPATIEVRFTKHEIEQIRCAEMFEMECLAKCKDAGIPVEGTLIFQGVKRGIITRFNDFETNDFVIQWRDTPDEERTAL